jgi:hypothetical protein
MSYEDALCSSLFIESLACLFNSVAWQAQKIGAY